MALEPRGTVRTKVELAGERETSMKLKRVEAGFRGLGSGAQGTIGALGQLGATAGVVAAGASALAVEIRAWGQAMEFAARQTYELTRRGGEVSAVATAFERIASPTVLREMQAVTGSLVDNVRLMQEFTQVSRAGMLSESEIVQAFALVTRASQDVGENVEGMIAQFARAASGGGMEFLTALGVNYAEITETVRAAGESMESAEGKALALREGLRLLEEQTTNTDNAAGHAGDSIQQMSVALTNMKDAAGRAVAENEGLARIVSELAAGVERFLPMAVRFGNVLGVALNMTLENTGTVAMHAQSALESLADHVEFTIGGENYYQRLADDLGAVRRELTDGGAAARSMQAAIRDLNREAAEMSEGLGPRGFQTIGGASYRDAPAASTARGRQASRGGGGGGRATPSGIGLESMLQLMSEQATLAREIADYREREAAAADELKAHLDEAARIEETRARELESALEIEMRAMELRQETEERYLSMRQLELEIAQQIAEKDEASVQANIQKIATSAGAAQSLAQIFGMLAEAEEEGSANADAWRKAQGVALGIYETVLAVSEAAKAIASIPGDPVGIVVHTAAAAMHGVAAGIAFSQLAQTGGGGGAAAQTSKAQSFRPAATRPHATGGMSDAGNTINVYSWGRSQADAGRVIAEQDWARVHKGAPVRVPRGIGYAA